MGNWHLFSQWRSGIGKHLAKPRFATPAPRLSIVVAIFNMQREAPRTLFSLSSVYQQNISTSDYEVIVVENGSLKPLAADLVAQFGANFRYLWIENASPSPAQAINRGVALSKAPWVGIMIDGARIATPGMVHLALQSLQCFERAVVGTVGFHLGPDTQMYSLRHGYHQGIEDGLLDRIDWRQNGYRLFNISALAGSSPRAWLDTINESNLIFLPRTLFDELGGYDEQFTSPGGGIVNLDFYRRACDLPNSTLITLLGEATFHQVHGGTITNQPASELPQRLQAYGEEYLRIRGRPFARSTRPPLLFGYLQPEIIPWLQKACDFAAPTFPPSLDNQEWRKALRKGDLSQTSTLQEQNEVFNLLKWLGLHEQHHVLELDGGGLLVGSLLISHLKPGGYFGITLIGRSFQEALMTTATDTKSMTLKQPRFARYNNVDLDVFDRCTGFDWILATPLFQHAGLTMIRRCLTSVRQILKPSGLLIANFIECAEDSLTDEWVYPEINGYRWATLAGLFTEAGLHCRKLDWPHPWQTWFVAAIDLRRLNNE